MGNRRGFVNGSYCYEVTVLPNGQQHFSKIIYDRLLMIGQYQLMYTLNMLGPRQLLQRVMLKQKSKSFGQDHSK